MCVAIQSLPMIAEQKKLLRGRLKAAIEHQPEIKILRKLLLRIGGEELVARPQPDRDVPILVEYGFVMAGPVITKPMGLGDCHRNLAHVWRNRRSQLAGIGTGYALSNDGLWRQHSWGVRREGIFETTEDRLKYFGILLQGPVADSFAATNG
jgi:hypothetical protein